MWLLFATLIFSLSGTLWVETTFYNNFTLIPSLTSLWDHLGKDERDYITEMGKAPQSAKRGQTCRVASPPSCALHSQKAYFWSETSWQLDMCLLLPLSQSQPALQIKGAHTWQHLLWVATHPARASHCGHHEGSAKLRVKARRRGWHRFYDML